MVIGSSITISASVGLGGRNLPQDLRAIQVRLNELLPLPRRRLALSGRLDRATVNLILEFQTVVLHMSRPSARIEPMGETLAALNDAASARVWGNATGSSRYVATLSSDAPRRTIAAMRRAAGTDRDRLSALDDFFAQAETVDAMSTWLSGASALENAAEFSLVLAELRALRLPPEAIRRAMIEAMGDGLDDLMELVHARPGIIGSASRGMSAANEVAGVIGLLISAYKITGFLRRGAAGIPPAVAEVYSAAMGMAVPWAGFIDGIQGVLAEIDPVLASAPTARMVFGLLTALNPIGLGRTGVDAVATVLVAIVRGFDEGRFSMTDFDAFVARARETPMRVFVEWGEGLGQIMGDRWGQAFYDRFLR